MLIPLIGHRFTKNEHCAHNSDLSQKRFPCFDVQSGRFRGQSLDEFITVFSQQFDAVSSQLLVVTKCGGNRALARLAILKASLQIIGSVAGRLEAVDAYKLGSLADMRCAECIDDPVVILTVGN